MEIELLSLLQKAARQQASDLFIISGSPLMMKLHGILTPCSEEKLTPADTERLLQTIYALASERSMTFFTSTGDDDFSFSVSGLGRFRCNAYRQRGSVAAVLRVMSFQMLSAGEMHIPQTVMDLCTTRKGMVLITGSAGSGKSTTLACM